MNRTSYFRGIAVSLALAPGYPAMADTYPVNPSIDISHYRFEIELSDKNDEIVAESTVTARFLDAGVKELRLDLVNRSEDAGGRGMTVTEVSSNGKSLRYSHRRDVLDIHLSDPSRKNETIDVLIRYSGEPANGFQIGDNKHGERTFFSNNWPNRARHWLPVVDHISDKATSEFVITAPIRLQVVSNGLLVEESNLGGDRRLTHWRQSVPTSPWLFALAAAEFAVQYVDEFDNKSIQTWVYKEDRDAGFFDFAVPTRHALSFFSDKIGPFAYEKLANIQSNSVGGGMEAASAIFYSDKIVTGDRTQRVRDVTVHEIAHQWFGNAVTEADWDDVWLSEGFATYFTQLYFEHAEGQDALVDRMRDLREKVYTFHASAPDYQIIHENLQEMADVTTTQTYHKGAWVLHMLRNKIGDESWWAGIQSYYKKYMNGHASTSDFLSEMQAACECDLNAFFQQWLYQGGNVILDGGWRYDATNNTIELSIEHKPSGDNRFDVTVEIGVYDGNTVLPTIHELPVTHGRARLSIPVTSEPNAVLLDPRTVLLAQWSFVEHKE